MNRSWLRSGVLAVVVVILAACGGTTTPTATAPAPTTQATAAIPQTAPAATPTAVPPTQQATTSAVPSTVAPPTEEASTEPSVTPPPTPVIVAPQSVAPGVTVVRWYCCLGAGDAPEQVAVETKVINDFNASHSDIQIQGEFVVYAQAYDTLATEIAGGELKEGMEVIVGAVAATG